MDMGFWVQHLHLWSKRWSCNAEGRFFSPSFSFQLYNYMSTLNHVFSCYCCYVHCCIHWLYRLHCSHDILVVFATKLCLALIRLGGLHSELVFNFSTWTAPVFLPKEQIPCPGPTFYCFPCLIYLM